MYRIELSSPTTCEMKLNFPIYMHASLGWRYALYLRRKMIYDALYKFNHQKCLPSLYVIATYKIPLVNLYTTASTRDVNVTHDIQIAPHGKDKTKTNIRKKNILQPNNTVPN